SAWLPFAAQVGDVQTELPQVASSESEAANAETGETKVEDAATAATLGQGTGYRDGTHLAAAIQAAAGYAPPGYVPRIVLLSDGNETAGDALATASRSRIPIHTVPSLPRSEPEVQVSAVNVPAEVREGEPFNVEAVVHSNHEDEGLIEIFRGDHKVIS